MNLFISDLDNTMIYSYKKDIGSDKVLVETKDGKHLSFMTKKSYDLLNIIRTKYLFVPATTRSLEQYRRIKFNQNYEPKLALVTNGGNLLYKNKIDDKYHLDSLKLIEIAAEQLSAAIKLLKVDKHVSFEVRMVDELFAFTKSDDLSYTIENLKDKLDLSLVDVLSNGSKVYVIPKSLNKGVAVNRIKEFTGIDYAFCAGDSEFDIPMLLESDLAFVPDNLSKNSKLKDVNLMIAEGDNIFSDYILSNLKLKM